MKSSRMAAILLSGASVLALPGTAQAQSSPAAEAATETIVVTGSRVTNGNNSPTPVTVLSTDALQNIRPSTLADTLQAIPVFAGSRSVLNNPFATGGSGAGNGVANQINLRNIGSQRNLVLMDGHRLPPTSTNNVIDIDMVPQLMIERIETVTGGTSAVYGSDAVTGVVNFITNKTLQGLKFQTSYGRAEYGGDDQFNIGAAWGTSFDGGRGHIEFSYDYRDNKGIGRRSDRSWYKRAVIAGSGTAATPYRLVENGTLPNTPFGGRVVSCGTTCTVRGQYFATDGVLSAFADGTPVVINGTTISNFQIGGAGGYYDSSLKAGLRSHQLFGRFDYDVNDDIKFFAVASANFKRNTFAEIDLTINNTLRSSNAFLTDAQKAALGPDNFTFGRIVRQNTIFSPRVDSTQMLGSTGFEGRIGEKTRWSVGYTYGESRLKTLLGNNVNEQRLRASLDAVKVGANVVCGINADSITTNDDPSCVPLNVFGPTSSSAAALDYVLADTLYTATTRTNNVYAELSTSPFDTWAGPAQVAFSAEYRNQGFVASTEANSNDFANCAGLLDCVQGRQPLWRQSFANSPRVSDAVKEAAVEVELPLLSDAPFAQSLTVNGAARYTDYRSVGTYWTWKLGASWELDDSLRVRGTVSRDIRAPTLNDLYAPVSTVVNSQQDLLLTNSPSYAVQQDTLGNNTLTPEIGHTWTVGAVWKPAFLSGFSAAIDYYDIRINEAIILAPGFSPLYQNACYASGGNSPFCSLQVRPNGYTDKSDPANRVTKYFVKPFNIGKIQTYGVDMELNWVGSVSGMPLRLRGMATWQPHIRYIQAGVPTTDQGGVAFGPVGMTASPKWRLTGTVSFQPTDAFRIDLQERWRSRLKYSNLATDVFVGPDSIAPQGVTSLNLAYSFKGTAIGDVEMFANIQNLFDVDPQPANGTATAGTPGRQNGFSQADDPVGRAYTVGLRMKL